MARAKRGTCQGMFRKSLADSNLDGDTAVGPWLEDRPGIVARLLNCVIFTLRFGLYPLWSRWAKRPERRNESGTIRRNGDHKCLTGI